MTHQEIEIDGADEARGYVIPLERCNLVFITKHNSLLACGAVDVMALDKLDVPAAKVTGVATTEELLNGEVKAVNDHAAALGVTVGESGRDALAKL